MTVTHGNGAGSPAGVTAARPLVLVRYRPGMAPETARVVHLVPLPVEGAGALSALCGRLLQPEEYEAVTPGHGMPCDVCVVSHAQHSDAVPSASDHPEAIPATAATPAAPDPTSPGITPRAAALGYRSWGWHVTLHRDQIWLALSDDAVAVLMPMLWAAEVTARLARRGSAPAVLARPDAPDHRVLLCGERYDIALPWPPGVHRISGSLLLPPTVTPSGPINWVHPPGPDALRQCREIDIVAAVQAILRDPPPTSGPMHF